MGILEVVPARAVSRQRIYAVVARIPRGRVATYGQVALLAGLPGQARQVGYALAALDDSSRIPWHRVVNAQGRISARRDGGPAARVQHLLLARERVGFGSDGRIPLERFRWRPRASFRGRP
ncbi:MAG TPA: MGMT family protein [Thermoanaerobaculia bacterium]|nr:MGMT family protein [Thermoanaerobaculia bacterium]